MSTCMLVYYLGFVDVAFVIAACSVFLPLPVSTQGEFASDDISRVKSSLVSQQPVRGSDIARQFVSC